MKSKLRFSALLIGVCMIISTSSAASENDFIIELRGDTAVIAGVETAGINSLYYAVAGDTTETGERNPNRVYETLRGGTYVYNGPAFIPHEVKEFRLVASKGDGPLPLHIKTTNPEGGNTQCTWRVNQDTYFKEQHIVMALTNNTYDRSIFASAPPNIRHEYESCIIELTSWTHIALFSTGRRFIFKNTFFHNIGREADLEKGNIIDGNRQIDSLWIENCTFLNIGNVVLTRPSAAPNFAYVNHNTFVNSKLPPFMYYAQAEKILTNNLFINTNMTPNYPGFYPFHEDADQLPQGIVNSAPLQSAWISDHWSDEYPVDGDADRKYLVDRNNAWWDSRLQDMFDNDLMPIPADIGHEWQSQMIIMNERTQDMFESGDYPYYAMGDWHNIGPDFANIKDNIDEWIEFITTNAKPGDPNGGTMQPIWRTNDVINLVVPDWPILADLSYTNADLMTAGINNYPLGDLNWFPELKAQWETTGEAEKLIEAMNNGELPADWAGVGTPDNLTERQQEMSRMNIFPNPFNESTTVQFNLVEDSNVEMIIYNILGKKVKVTELGHRSSGINEVILNKGGLNPGMYMIRLNTSYNDAGLISRIIIQ